MENLNSELSNEAKRVIEILTNKLPKVVGFVSVRNYENKAGEIANHKFNVGAKLSNAKAKDIKTLNDLDVTTLNSIVTVDSITLEKARLELIKALITPNKTRSDAQINAYTIISNGVKVHNTTGDVYVFGKKVAKDVLKKGEYKVVKSRPLTIAKNELRKDMESAKYRQFIIKADKIKETDGNVIEFE